MIFYSPIAILLKAVIASRNMKTVAAFSLIRVVTFIIYAPHNAKPFPFGLTIYALNTPGIRFAVTAQALVRESSLTDL
jgi:hypothetical protein